MGPNLDGKVAYVAFMGAHVVGEVVGALAGGA